MASRAVEQLGATGTSSLLLSCVTANGSGVSPYVGSQELLKGPFASRNLADAVHFLCILHGRHPGVLDHAANRSIEPTTRGWFNATIEAFATERAFLAKLAVAAGPLPSTPGASDNDAVVRSQRHAIDTLAQSERNGCALGAAMGLVIDWGDIRGVLNAAAARFGVDTPPYRLMDTSDLRTLADALEDGSGARRALLFGAEQVALQHRGLWDLLDARQQARGIY